MACLFSSGSNVGGNELCRASSKESRLVSSRRLLSVLSHGLHQVKLPIGQAKVAHPSGTQPELLALSPHPRAKSSPLGRGVGALVGTQFSALLQHFVVSQGTKSLRIWYLWSPFSSREA